ncbi:Zn-ribbon domain-containing OB-fold protein [Spirillospora sp. CA-253888]
MDQPRPAPAPAPRPSPLTAPYWEACRRGELAVQRCSGCGRHVHFPEPSCPYCGGTDLPYRTVSGHGAVHTFSVVHRTFLPGFEPPYVVAWIDLAEGARPPRRSEDGRAAPAAGSGGIVPSEVIRVFGDVTGCPPEDVRIGMPVRVHFTDLDGFGPLPHWRPAP